MKNSVSVVVVACVFSLGCAGQNPAVADAPAMPPPGETSMEQGELPGPPADAARFGYRLDSSLSAAPLSPEVDGQLERLSGWLQALEPSRSDARESRGLAVLLAGSDRLAKRNAVTALGSRSGRAVFRVMPGFLLADGVEETRQNIAALFAAATTNDWVLLLDGAELADVMPGEARGRPGLAADFSGYLESFPGMSVFLAADAAELHPLSRRSIGYGLEVPRPDSGTRARLWAHYIGDTALHPDVDLRRLADDHDLTTRQIALAVDMSLAAMIQAGDDRLSASHLFSGVRSTLRSAGLLEDR